MSEGKIVILEGTSCVGKTTLCEYLQKQGWVVLPEAIRYLEKETGLKGDEASPEPGSQKEEEYYQDQLFRVERQKIIEANRLRQEGKNVVIDKCAIATVATAKAFEKSKGFNGTFRRAYNKYCKLLTELANMGLVECDVFLLLTSDYETIYKRNATRNHVLEGVWIDPETIRMQREALETLTSEVVGSIGCEEVKKVILDTSHLSISEVQARFNSILNDLEKDRD